MEFIHFSKEVVVDTTKYYKPPVPFDNFKPKGLWISDESDYGWAKWCQAEHFSLGNLENAHLITIKPDANVLYIKTVDELDKFTAKYKIQMIPGEDRITTIDWQRVAKDYQGIVITPYQWERRLDHNSFWYYGWDCSSGCIWDLSAIQSARMVENKWFAPPTTVEA